MIAILALFPGDEDGIVLRQWGGSTSADAEYLAEWGVRTPGLYRLDWTADENEPPTVIRLADLPAIPEEP